MRFILPVLAAGILSAGPFPDPGAVPAPRPTSTGQGTQDKLSADTRVAVVRDRQGLATVRPVSRRRWTPIGPGTALMPGDQVRTSVRGANAVELALAGGGRLVLGPGGLVEVLGGADVRIFRGELEVVGPVRIRAPGAFEREVAESLMLRSDGRETGILEDAPRWLTGYRDSTTDEWMGSLIAQVDGRDVPLSVGYHKVDVDIRDQIARTTVEQSFVNSTNGTLEGVFYFPLPADASISGFGMWIGGELVEADIVEKQRARAIYEDILRRRKDPGLLEWSGGNLFKARVFPIFPHSEKRIRIRYTQVLPLEGDTLRYRYGLRSELLRSRPLRELDLNVRVSSSVPITGVASPTHEVRIRQTGHAASAEFSAEEFTPQRDFELTLQVERSAALTAVPHRRGDDGYFMLLLSPDGPPGWERELVPESGPLDLLLIADTSASMDAAAREAQRAFLDGLLSMLAPTDRFRLLACDVEPRWFQRDPAPVTEDRVRAALRFLDQRRSLGWTDIDRTLAALRVEAGTTVVYVGDGIGTTGDADPTALAQRIRRLRSEATFHAVSTSATYEAVVLQALASIGGGSVRRAGDDPLGAAHRLLAEIAQPAVVDLEVRFEGLRTARVYPERLPNLAAGSQQVVLGRFLPTGGTQRGSVTVTGTRDGRPVRYIAELILDEQEEGNSFIPRLWARRHIDALLEEGSSPEVREEIVGFSEEFGIMTPYTSFLVLESDADRERYGVQRRVAMRDGERFFAEGRDRARTELLAKQMKAARGWRIAMQQRMLAEIATLGRHLHEVAVGWNESAGQLGAFRSNSGPISRGGEMLPGGSGNLRQQDQGAVDELDDFREGKDDPVDPDAISGLPEEEPGPALHDAMEPASAPLPDLEMAEAERVRGKSVLGFGNRAEERQDQLQQGRFSRNAYLGGGALRPTPGFGAYRFPNLPPAPEAPPEFTPADWPEEVIALLQSLDRRPALKSLAGGISLRLDGGSLHPLRGHWLRRERVESVLRGDGWFVRRAGEFEEPLDHWLWAGKRGALAVALRLGRQREARPGDATAWPLPLRDLSLVDLRRVYAGYEARLAGGVDPLATVLLTAPGSGRSRVRLVIDREKSVLVELMQEHQGRAQRIVRFSDFVAAGERWWARRVEELDGEERTVGRYSLEIAELGGAAAATRLHEIVARHGDVLFVGPEDPEPDAAKQAIADRRAGFAEYFAVALHYVASGQWEEVFAHWRQAEQQVAGKPGVLWLQAALLAQGRRGEELKQRVAALAGEVSRGAGPAPLFSAMHCLALAGSVYQAHEVLELLDLLEPAFRSGGERGRIVRLQQRARWLSAAGRPADSRDLYREVAAARPGEIQAVLDHLESLRQSSDHREVDRVAAAAMEDQRWLDGEAERIYELWTRSLWELRDLRSMLPVLESWIARRPAAETAHQRRLSTLLYLDREVEADAWVSARLGAPAGADLSPADRAALGAAIQYCLGHGWNYWQQRIDERWYGPLADLGRRLVRVDEHGWLAARIFNDGRFSRTDAGAELRRSLIGFLTPDAVASLPLPTLGRYLGWIPWGRTQIDEDVFATVLDLLRERWSRTELPADRQTLAQHMLRLLDARPEPLRAIALLRQELDRATAAQRPGIANQLLNRLTAEPWTAAREDEAIDLITLLQPPESSQADRRRLYAATLRWLVDRLESGRYDALMGPAREYEKLSRQELARKRSESRRRARRELADRLSGGAPADPLLSPWLSIERLGLLAQLGEDRAAVDGEVRELLFSVAADSADPTEQILRERCAYVIAYLATRPGSAPGLVDGAVALLDQRVDDEPQRLDGYRIDWRYHLFRLLVALDRAARLAEELDSWIVPSRIEARWRTARAYLLAETGQLAEAASVLESLAGQDELGAAEHRALADWYLVLDEPQRRERALSRQYEVSSENELQRRLNLEIQRVARRGDGVPADLDVEVLRALRALLHKAGAPARYVWQVRQLYDTVKDFRILECLADGVTGHTPQGIYPFLEQVGSVLDNVHEEATCDTLAGRIAALSTGAEGVDRRALQLLQVLVERRAAKVLDQPGPHGERALSALRSAFRGSWQDGERRLMASFLASLGAIELPALEAEQLRQLEVLHQEERDVAHDRLQIALHLANTYWAYGDHDRAMDTLAAALAGYRAANQGVLPGEANGPADTLIGWYENRRRFGAAERWLRDQLAATTHQGQRSWLTSRLFQVYVRCLGADGAVALGRGAGLYRASKAEMEAWMFAAGPSEVPATVTWYCQLHHNAFLHAGVRTAGTDLEAFGRQTLPELLTVLPGNVQSVVSTVAGTLEQLSGPRVALGFLIERIESEPRWYSRVNQGGWRHFAYNLARWRPAAEPLGDLEPRLLAIVLSELERDLLSLQQQNRVIYQIHNSYFWHAKAEAFATVARRVIETHPDSPARLLYAADYLWSGLALRDEAIDTLVAAEDRGMLREQGRHRLVVWLHEQRRYGESLALLELLTGERPDNLEYRTLKVRALHETGRDADALGYLAATEARFKEHEAWNEPVIAALARIALTCDFHRESAAYYEAVIPLHQRTQRNRGVGNGTLSSYYGELARAYVALGDSARAVDAASAAVVSWGRTHRSRTTALRALQSVIEQVDDLDGYVRRRQQRVDETGMDAPLLRKTIGRVYLARRQPDMAVPQLLAARDLQPQDTEIHEALLASYDALGEKQKACQALLAAIEATPMDLELYRDLGTRLQALGETVEAERAFTSLAEMEPHEAAGHRLLAEHREQQQRHTDAVEQWRQVVRVRADEPAGWLSLSRAQVRAGDIAAAKQTLQEVIERTWEPRFGDVRRQALRMLAPLSKPPR